MVVVVVVVVCVCIRRRVVKLDAQNNMGLRNIIGLNK